MKKTRLKDLLQTLSLEEQKEILMAHNDWIIHAAKMTAKAGRDPRMGWGFYESRLERRGRLEEILDNQIAKNLSLGFKEGIVPEFRVLPQLAREAPDFNAFMRDHLPAHIFRQYYQAAGLDVDQLEYGDYNDLSLW